MEIEEFERYKRQVPVWGREGQEKISNAKVAIAGLGGLGNASAYYLAAAGIGTLGIVDNQRVQLSDLNRQILFGTKDTGKLKVKIAAEKLKSLNPNINVKPINKTLTKSSINILDNFDIIIDGTDNYETRFLLSDYCFKKNKIFIFAAADSMHGFASVLRRGTPCLRCIIKKVSCRGCRAIVGMIPGIIGLVQALETLKLVTSGKSSLENQLLVFNGKTLDFDKIKIEKNKACKICKGL